MHHITNLRSSLAASVMMLTALLALPTASLAQDVSGQAAAIHSNVLGMTTSLADTGSLNGVDDARETSKQAGYIPNVGGAEVLHATTISSVYGWDSADSVASEASLSNIGFNIGGNSISAAFAMAQAIAPVADTPVGTSSVEGLLINNSPVYVSGQPNQTINLIGGRIILNEQRTANGETIVNALHIIVDGVADVAVASARAGIVSDGSGNDPVDDPLDPITDPIDPILGGLGL